MNHLFGDPWVYLHLIWLYKPPFSSSLICAIELWRWREEVLEWKIERLCEKCEDWNWIQEFCFPTKILLSNKFVKMSKTCKSFLKLIFDKRFCVKPVLTNFSQFIELHETNFSSWLWRTHFRSNIKKYFSESNGTRFIVI